jgi:hypothetical protein
MATASLLAPLIAARVTATADDDGHLLVRPAGRITPDLRAYIRTHRDELIAGLSKSAETLSNAERDRALPPGLKPSYCPTCNGRTVVVSPAADHLLCAGCAPPWEVPRRRSRSGNPSGEAP